MKILIAASATLAALTSQAVAAESKPVPLGFGARICADWTSYRALGGERDAVTKQWLLGFFSGYNTYGPSGKSLLLSYDEKNLLRFVDQRCAANPKQIVASVAEDFIAGLRRSTARHKVHE